MSSLFLLPPSHVQPAHGFAWKQAPLPEQGGRARSHQLAKDILVASVLWRGEQAGGLLLMHPGTRGFRRWEVTRASRGENEVKKKFPQDAKCPFLVPRGHKCFVHCKRGAHIYRLDLELYLPS